MSAPHSIISKRFKRPGLLLAMACAFTVTSLHSRTFAQTDTPATDEAPVLSTGDAHGLVAIEGPETTGDTLFSSSSALEYEPELRSIWQLRTAGIVLDVLAIGIVVGGLAGATGIFLSDLCFSPVSCAGSSNDGLMYGLLGMAAAGLVPGVIGIVLQVIARDRRRALVEESDLQVGLRVEPAGQTALLISGRF